MGLKGGYTIIDLSDAGSFTAGTFKTITGIFNKIKKSKSAPTVAASNIPIFIFSFLLILMYLKGYRKIILFLNFKMTYFAISPIHFFTFLYFISFIVLSHTLHRISFPLLLVYHTVGKTYFL